MVTAFVLFALIGYMGCRAYANNNYKHKTKDKDTNSYVIMSIIFNGILVSLVEVLMFKFL